MSNARVVRIIDVKPLADRLDIVHVAGWRDRQSITQRDQFRPGDLGILITPGSVVPMRDPFRWLWDLPDSPMTFRRHQRRRTIGVRRYQGEYSHGLVMHPKELGLVPAPGDVYSYVNMHDGVIGDTKIIEEDVDVSDICLVEPDDSDDILDLLSGWGEPKCSRPHMPQSIRSWFMYLVHRWYAAL